MARSVQLLRHLSSPISIGPGIPEFRVFPYENASLEPFETAVAALNPVVAVKVRSAAVHAALAEVYVYCLALRCPDSDSTTRFLVTPFVTSPIWSYALIFLSRVLDNVGGRSPRV
jgi:hypothetical protein